MDVMIYVSSVLAVFMGSIAILDFIIRLRRRKNKNT